VGRIESFRIKSGYSQLSGVGLGVTAALAALGLCLGGAVGLPAQAETFLEESGTILPAEHSYTFEGTAGQSVTITLESDEFDPMVSLFDAAGNEIGFNDDFGGSLNSMLIMTLPEDGVYTVVARSFSSNSGGDYELVVRLSTPFETTLMEAQTLAQEGSFEAAIARYTDAIALDGRQSVAYLGRAEAVLSQVYAEQGDRIEGPEDLPQAVRDAIALDFEKAADLLTDNPDRATYLREQAKYLRTGALPMGEEMPEGEAP
jgi:tetratricopeptide (TPR) repeat protein